MIERMTVDLPTPLRPSSATHWPRATAQRHAEQRARQPVVGADRVDFEHRAHQPLSQVHAPHLGVGADRLGRAVGDHAALVQHGDAIGGAEHHVHVVLGEQQRQAALAGDAAQQLHRLARLGRATCPRWARRAAAARACRPARCRARAASGCRATASPPASVGLVGEVHVGQQRHRPRRGTASLGARPQVAAAAAVRDQRRLHVLEHR